MVSFIWAFFLCVGILYSFFRGNIDLVSKEILSSTKQSLDMMMNLFPTLALWLGIMKIAEDSNLLSHLSSYLSKYLSKLFPDIPKNSKTFSYIASNIICNFFGLGSAATPFGLKAISSMQEVNKKKDTASKSMITFLVINTCGLTLIPTTLISLRYFYHSKNPTSIILPCFLATLFSTFVGLLLNFLIGRKYE